MSFKEDFAYPMSFEPEGMYLDGSYSADEALALFNDAYPDSDAFDHSDLEVAYVRFQPTPAELRGDISDMAWITVPKGTKRAQKCWVVGA